MASTARYHHTTGTTVPITGVTVSYLLTLKTHVVGDNSCLTLYTKLTDEIDHQIQSHTKERCHKKTQINKLEI